MFACSLDGSVACMQFEGNELGDILPFESTKERLRNIYGVSTFATDNLLVESTAQLALEKDGIGGSSGAEADAIGAAAASAQAAALMARRNSNAQASSRIPEGVPTMTSSEASVGMSARAMRSASITAGMRFATSTGTNSPVRRRQIESKRKKDGRKRITPVLIVESSNNSQGSAGENSGNGMANMSNGPRPAAMLPDMNDRERLRGVISVQEDPTDAKAGAAVKRNEGSDKGSRGVVANAKKKKAQEK